jgi:FkbM family methyltransferase
MTFKGILNYLGIKPKPKIYGCSVIQVNLEEFGPIDFARWQHPAEGEKTIEVGILKVLQSFLKSGDFCIDIGAHSGDTTVPMALVVGKDGCVLALEPNKYVYATLEKNASLNKEKTNIIPLLAAATETNGTFYFQYSDPGFCNGGLHKGISLRKHRHHFKLQVNGIKLEEALRKDYSQWLPKIRYIKMDTEGYDLFVLKSIVGVIDEFHPYIRAEVYEHTTLEY